ncbi:MAG: DUF6029 family protein [Candidatus Eisenbacteria bacterium]
MRAFRRAAASACVVTATLVALALPAHAQLSGSSLLIGQAGNWPATFADRGSPNRESTYGLVNLQYLSGELLAGGRFETDRNSDQQNEYQGVTQRFADWSHDRLHVRVGNLYTILGRGLTHRSFELTGVVLENTSFRSRWTPSRDVDGVLLEYARGPLHGKLLTGSPSDGTVSLAEQQLLDREQHRGHLSGGELSFDLPRGLRAGATYLRTGGGVDPLTQLPRQQEAGSGFVEFDPFQLAGSTRASLPLYFEYAQQDRTFGEWWRFARTDDVPHALYASTSLAWGPFGLAAEWKDYAKFALGTNDLPSLVREHSALLLNRSTHVLLAQREEGYQFELSWMPRPGATLIGNLSRADNARGDQWVERYFEARLAAPADARWEAGVFVDRSADSALSVLQRDTYGINGRVRWRDSWTIAAEAERQTAARVGFDFETFGIVRQRFENVHASLAVTRADRGSLAVAWERTTDPLDPSWDFGRKRALHFMGWTAAARIAERHEAVLFAGQRRGGLACTAGTCYEVQPFKGVELRLVSRF